MALRGQGWGQGRFSPVWRGTELWRRFTVLGEVERSVTLTPWLRSPVAPFRLSSKKSSLFSLTGLSGPSCRFCVPLQVLQLFLLGPAGR